MGSRHRRLKGAVYAAISEQTRVRSLLAMYTSVAKDLRDRGLGSVAADVIVAVDLLLIDLESAIAALAVAIAACDEGKVQVHYLHRRAAGLDSDSEYEAAP